MTLTEGAALALAHARAALENVQVGILMDGRDPARAADALALTERDVRATVRALHGAGVEAPQGAHTPQPIPLHQLDTPDARALLAGIEELLPIAERIDAARGRALERPVAGARGLDLAEALNQLRHRLRLEIHGPGAAITGGRE